jgi:hypothetical protein
VPELALDQRQRDTFVHQLDGVRVAQLVRREPAPDPCPERQLATAGARSERRPDRPALWLLLSL